jgi:hypothetical protein
MPNNLENMWNFICKIITNGNWDFTFKMSFWFLILNFFSYKLCSVYVIGSFVVCSFCHKCNPFIIQEFFFFSISYHYYFSSLSWFLYYGFKLKLHSIVLSKNIFYFNFRMIFGRSFSTCGSLGSPSSLRLCT